MDILDKMSFEFFPDGVKVKAFKMPSAYIEWGDVLIIRDKYGHAWELHQKPDKRRKEKENGN